MEAMDSIAKKTQSLTTAEDMRNQTKLLMQPYANWEKYLTPAPLSIAILGELVFISSSTDFSINKNPPIGGYKYIKQPDSFRASLMQVCNSGWWAFNEAHNNMDQIRLHTANVPGYMKQAVNILFQGNDEVVEALLPNQLENIEVIADKCLPLSDSTKKCFSDVINTIHELLEVCFNAKHIYGEEKEAIKMKLEETELRKQSAEMHKCTMGNYELKEINFNTTIKMLFKGMEAMGRVMVQWEKMVHFFQMVSNIVKISLRKTLRNFISTSEKTQKLSYNAKLFSKDLLYSQAFQASDIASLVHMISGTYTEIFNKYLMDPVSSLSKLMTMDKSKPEFEQERHKLQEGCREAQEGILELVLKNKDEFDKKSTARLEKIDRELLAILPAVPPKKINLSEDAVKAGFSEEELSSYY